MDEFPAIAAQMRKTCPHCSGIYLGDIYEKGLRSDKDFYKLVYDPLKPMVTYLALGNHGSKGAFLRTEDHIRIPCKYYAIKSPSFSFFVFDTQHLTSKQMKDAEEFLCNNPNPVGVGHKSILTYESGHGNSTEIKYMRPVEKLLHKCGSKLFISGHSHVLELNATPLGLLNIVSGGAGRGIRRIKYGKSLFNKATLGFAKLKKDYVKFYDDKGKKLFEHRF